MVFLSLLTCLLIPFLCSLFYVMMQQSGRLHAGEAAQAPLQWGGPGERAVMFGTT